MCLNGVLFSLNTFVRALNSLLGTLRAFRSPTPLNVPLPQAARRRAGERSVPSIPSLPWSAKEKVIAVGLGRCYALFTPAKVVLFLGLFSPSQTSQFLNPFGMCKLHLRTCSVARRHERKNFFLRVWGELRQQLQRRGLGCMVNRQRWTRTRSSERATFLLPVLARDAFSAFVGFVLRRDWVLPPERKGRYWKQERAEKDSSWIDKLQATRGILPWLSVSVLPVWLFLLCHLVANVYEQGSCFEEHLSYGYRQKDCPRRTRCAASSSSRWSMCVAARKHSETHDLPQKRDTLRTVFMWWRLMPVAVEIRKWYLTTGTDARFIHQKNEAARGEDMVWQV